MNARLPLALLVVALAAPLPAQQQQPKAIGEGTLFGEESLRVEAATKPEFPVAKAPDAVTDISAKQLAGGDAQLFGGARSTGVVNAQYGKKSGAGSIFGSLRLLQSQMPQEFWLDDHSKIKAQDIFVKGTLHDLQVSAYRHHDSLDGFAEKFPPGLGLPPGSEFASAHDVRQTLDILSLKYNHAPQNAAVTY